MTKDSLLLYKSFNITEDVNEGKNKPETDILIIFALPYSLSLPQQLNKIKNFRVLKTFRDFTDYLKKNFFYIEVKVMKILGFLYHVTLI